jgi:beta-N-acetylhexosaminidase
MGNIGQHFIAGIPGPELTAADVTFLNEIKPSGVCLFARNIKEPQQVRDLTDSIKSILGPESLICIDQEGGRVDRLRRILEPMPPAESLREVSHATELGMLSASALRLIGVNVNFAPVVDVPRISQGTIDNGLQTRMLGTDAEKVVRLAESFIESSKSRGILLCLKHFPGLGASTVDSHEALPSVTLEQLELEQNDLLPYRSLASKRECMVMIAHAVYPRTSFNRSDNQIPSSLNPLVYSYLRESVAFQGLAVTDDLEMGAIIKSYGIPEASRMAITAGADIALICNDQDAVRRAYEICIADPISESHSHATASRLEALKKYLLDPIDFDSDEWEHLSIKIRELKQRLP